MLIENTLHDEPVQLMDPRNPSISCVDTVVVALPVVLATTNEPVVESYDTVSASSRQSSSQTSSRVSRLLQKFLRVTLVE